MSQRQPSRKLSRRQKRLCSEVGNSFSKSPLAPPKIPELNEITGVILRAGACGIKKNNEDDFFIASFSEGTSVAGVFTKSQTRSSAVDYCKKHLKAGKARAFLVNAGNSNAFTGKLGETTVKKSIEAAARLLKCKKEEIFTASTGVIGVPLKAELITEKLSEIYKSGKSGWAAAAKAFCTTDTFIKMAKRQAKIGDKQVTINGIAKGSGMIAPDMATLLAFVATDAAIPSRQLQKILNAANEKTFNSITVDSDTSTSDTVLAFATNQVRAKGSLADFAAKFEEVLLDLAQQVVKDGEGASKFIKIEVIGAINDKSAKKIGLSIANSPLVKTAIAGEDANWGRIVMAVGKSGEKAERDKLTVKIGGITLAKKGQLAKNFDEAPVAKHMKGENIHIFVDIGLGRGQAIVWTCDLTHGYISINADYRS